MGEAAVGQANYFCAAPESLRQAFESCGLTAKERDFLFATVALCFAAGNRCSWRPSRWPEP